jgi:hypothetical protein
LETLVENCAPTLSKRFAIWSAFHGPAPVSNKAEVKEGSKSVHQAYKEIKSKERKQIVKKDLDIEQEIEKLFRLPKLESIKMLLLSDVRAVDNKTRAVKNFAKIIKDVDVKLRKLISMF